MNSMAAAYPRTFKSRNGVLDIYVPQQQLQIILGPRKTFETDDEVIIALLRKHPDVEELPLGSEPDEKPEKREAEAP
jgi:hypothetical protein